MNVAAAFLTDPLRSQSLTTVTLSGVEVALNPSLSPLIRLVLRGGLYETPERQLVERHLRPWDTVMELGAGLGVLSTLCAKKGNKVFAYEANPQMIPLIRDTYRRNGVQSIHLKNCILGEETGEVPFFLHRDFWRSSTVGDPKQTYLDCVRVPVVKAADELFEVKPTFLICDIEGGEVDLFKTLHFPESLRKLVIEVHPAVIGEAGIDRLLADLYAAGYVLGETLGDVWFLSRQD